MVFTASPSSAASALGGLGAAAPASALGELGGSALLAALGRIQAAPGRVQAGGPVAGGVRPAGAFAERLGQWLSWTDAVALVGMLDGDAAEARVAQAPPDAARLARAQDALQQLRASLTRGILDDDTLAPARPPQVAGQRPGPRSHWAAPVAGPAPAEPDWASGAPLAFAPYRHCHQASQQTMDLAVQALRERLRALLASGGPALAHLAAVDAAMQRTLAPQAQRLLGQVPAALERHFLALQQAAVPPGLPGAPAPAGPPAWLRQFCQDQQGLLLAELDFRLQPLQALIDALREATAAAPRTLP